MLLYFFPLVVISTTPFFALLPYFLMAALPFKTFTDSISSGYILSYTSFFTSFPSSMYIALPITLTIGVLELSVFVFISTTPYFPFSPYFSIAYLLSLISETDSMFNSFSLPNSFLEISFPFNFKTYRRNDMKVMQVRTSYFRRGGDAPSLAHPSSYG